MDMLFHDLNVTFQGAPVSIRTNDCRLAMHSACASVTSTQGMMTYGYTHVPERVPNTTDRVACLRFLTAQVLSPCSAATRETCTTTQKTQLDTYAHMDDATLTRAWVTTGEQVDAVSRRLADARDRHRLCASTLSVRRDSPPADLPVDVRGDERGDKRVDDVVDVPVDVPLDDLVDEGVDEGVDVPAKAVKRKRKKKHRTVRHTLDVNNWFDKTAGKVVYVMFTTSKAWCTDCVVMEKTFSKAMQRIHGTSKGVSKDVAERVHVATLDCDTKEGMPLCVRHHIRTVPHIMYGNPQDLKRYTGASDVKSLVEHMSASTDMCDAFHVDECDDSAMFDALTNVKTEVLETHALERRQALHDVQKTYDEAVKELQDAYKALGEQLKKDESAVLWGDEEKGTVGLSVLELTLAYQTKSPPRAPFDDAPWATESHEEL